MIQLTATQARRLVITCQGLNKSHAFGRGASAPLQCIERLGYVQIDTISVINRAHLHTIWTRVPAFQSEHLDALQRDRKIFEYWSHAAAYLPIKDFRYCLPYMNAIASGQKHWRIPDKKSMKLVLDCIRSRGAMRARDFASSKTKQPDFWGHTTSAKIALEQLFIEGQLLVSHREGFQKVYDLPERVLPAELDTSPPSAEEFQRYLIDRTIQSQGFATVAEIGYLRKGLKSDLRKRIQQMHAEREITQVKIAGNPNEYYSRTSIIETATSTRVAKEVHLLSPFDNLVIQRKRMAQLFDFEYQIECYVPAAKRKHGYFCLPILFGDELVGRLDPKADRKNRKLIIRRLFIEKRIQHMDKFIHGLAKKIASLAAFNACDRISIESCNRKEVGSVLSRLVGSRL